MHTTTKEHTMTFILVIEPFTGERYIHSTYTTRKAAEAALKTVRHLGHWNFVTTAH